MNPVGYEAALHMEREEVRERGVQRTEAADITDSVESDSCGHQRFSS